MTADGATVPLEYHRSLIEVMGDAVVGTDADFRVTIWNPAAERLYGYTADEAIGRLGRELATYEGDPSRLELEDTLERTGREHTELVARRRDGSFVAVELLVTSVTGEDGTILGYLGIHRDITERRRAAEEHRRLSAVVENSPDFIGLANLDGMPLFVNKAGRRMVGIDDAAQLPAEHVLDFFPAEDRKQRDGLLARIRTEGRVDEELDFVHFRTGERIPVSFTGFRVDDPRTGEPIGLATISRDLTERRGAQAALDAYRREIDTIFANMTDAFFALDRKLRYVYLNDRAIQLIGEMRGEPLTRDDLLGAKVFDIFPEEVGNLVARRFRDALERQRPVAFENLYRPRNRWFAIDVYASEGGLAVYFRDITERKATEAARKRQARQQAATAELGIRASRVQDVVALMDEAVAVIARTLEVELVGVAELLRTRDHLLLRAGIGWSPGWVGRHEIPIAPPMTVVSHAAATEEPIVSEDIALDERLVESELLRAHGVTSAAAVAIPGRRGSFGAIAVCSRERRRFTDDEVNFLRAIANVLSSAVDRAAMAQRVRDAREAERRRIARALHDETLQELGVALAAAAAPPGAGAPDEGLVATLQRVGEQIHAAIDDLRLRDAHDWPFPVALDELVAVHRTASPDCAFGVDVRDVPQRLPDDMGHHVLRFLGEALTNVRRHAGATRVELSVAVEGASLVARVADDGRGLDLDRARQSGRHGLVGMGERAELLGGEMRLGTRPAGGTVVELRAPLFDPREPGRRARVLLVDDHAAVREALALAFTADDAFVVIGQAGSLAEARTMLDGVDVAIVDLALPDGDGTELIAELRAASADAQALVLSAHVDRASTARAVERGAAGVLAKATHLHEVVAAVHRLRAGDTLIALDEMVELLRYAGRERERELDDQRLVESLTPREREVLQLLADGLDGRRVAARLHISPRTQRNHVANILAKLRVHSQLQALVFALRHGVVVVQRETPAEP